MPRRTSIVILLLLSVCLVLIACVSWPLGVPPTQPPLSETNVEEARAQYMKGYTLYQTGRFPQALPQLRKVVDLYPDSEWADDAQYLLGYCYWHMNSYVQAMDEWRSMIERYPDSEWADDAQFSIAKAYDSLREFDKALAEYQELIDNYPDSNWTPQARERIEQLQDSVWRPVWFC